MAQINPQDVQAHLDKGEEVFVVTRGAYDPRKEKQTAEILGVLDDEDQASLWPLICPNYHVYGLKTKPVPEGREIQPRK